VPRFVGNQVNCALQITLRRMTPMTSNRNRESEGNNVWLPNVAKV
jgi:hypothetical protein